MPRLPCASLLLAAAVTFASLVTVLTGGGARAGPASGGRAAPPAGAKPSVAAVAAPATDAGEPSAKPPSPSVVLPGPAFGKNRFRTEIGPWSGDRDEFTARLSAGESLSVHVAAARESSLRPALELIDPGGVPREVPLRRTVTARRVAFRGFVADVSGPWTVRVSGADGTIGAYTAAFAVRGPPVARFRGERVGPDAGAVERAHVFEAAAGSVASFVLRARGAAHRPELSALEDPAGTPLSLPVRRGGRGRGTWSGAPLAGADGEHTVTVALEEGAATYSLDVRVTSPGRPRGTVDLSRDEPRLAAVAAPIRGGSARIVRLLGVNFSPGVRPTVRFGGERALVVAVAPTGIWMDVSPPIRPVGTVCDVLVTNPDGQSVRAPSYFEYVDPPPPVLDRFVPAVAAAYVSSSLRLTVALREPAPFGGVPIDLSVEGAIGDVPPTVTVPGGESFVRFDLASASRPAAGRIAATYGGRTVAAEVAVVALPEPEPDDPPAPPPPLPDFLDVSGWTIAQTSSARTYTFPEGTRLRQGDRVVIGRAATQSAFETYWGVTFGDDVHYLTNDPTNTGASSDDWPSINGDETFTVRDASGALVDGPTVAMQAGGAANYARTPGTAAGQPDSWTVLTTLAPGAGPTPGSVPSSSDATKHGLWISEFSDVSSGANRYAFEFVELCFDGNP